jgi:protein CpxP
MKKVLFAAGITLLGLSAVYAQNLQKKAAVQSETSARTAQPSGRNIHARTPEQIADAKTARMDKEVGMTADQKKKIYDILLKDAQQNRGRAALHQETNTQVKSVLTPEQNQKLEARQAERQQMMQERRQSVRQGNLKSAPAKQETAQ